MKVLYISEDYLSTKVHHNLCYNLSKYGLDITVYTVSRNSNQEFSIDNTYSDINYNILLNKLEKGNLCYKYDFFYKVKVKYEFLRKKIVIKDYDFVIAATSFSEGAIAYKIYEEYKIPYIVSVRGTDINMYIKKMIHLWQYGKKILSSAKSIIFITKNIKEKYDSTIFSKIYKIKNNFSVISNGIDTIWLDNISLKKKYNNKILYIGRFDSNKNVLRLLSAVQEVKRDLLSDVSITLIGGGGQQHPKVMELCNENPSVFSYLGKIYDKEKLISIMREHSVFAMVSHSETFGLVYLEALSQGLNIVCTRNQGVDGVFKEKVGEFVESHKVSDIKEALYRLLTNRDDYSLLSEDEIRMYSWPHIARRYLKLIKED